MVREAVKVLAAKGLVVSRPRTGTRVRPSESWNLLDPDVLAWQQEGLPRGVFLEKLTEVRLLIEPGAAALAALRAGPEEVAAIQRALRDMGDALDRTPPDHEAYNDADIQFHRAIVQACDNDVLEQMGNMVSRALLIAFNAAVRVPGLARSSLPRHQAIVDAIRRRQPNRARAAMERLVQNTGRSIERLPVGRPVDRHAKPLSAALRGRATGPQRRGEEPDRGSAKDMDRLVLRFAAAGMAFFRQVRDGDERLVGQPGDPLDRRIQ